MLSTTKDRTGQFQSPTWIPKLTPQLKEIESASQLLSAARLELLNGAATEIAAALSQEKEVGLNFICTHNSRRSHLGQVWAAVAAARWGLQQLKTYSGGTEATACNERIVRSLRGFGFSVVTLRPFDANPEYWLQFAEDVEPVRLFSKVFDHADNPQQAFFAMVCCDHADVNCPVIPGAVGRVSLHYRDPKESDGTQEEATVYDERRDEIGAEMFFLMQQVAKISC